MKNNATCTIRSEEITIDVRICAALAANRGGEVYLAAIAPDMELTVITLDEAPDILPCFEEDDAYLNLPNTSLLLCYNPAQVLKMGGKHYLTGPVILVRTNMDGEGLQSFFIGITMRILSIVIFVIVYGRMIEIYMMVSLAPVPMATWGNHEQSHVGQNYLRSLFALGFQGFLILICVAIYAVLLQNVAISGDAINSIWSIVGYTVLLCFSLFKTGSVARSILGAH